MEFVFKFWLSYKTCAGFCGFTFVHQVPNNILKWIYHNLESYCDTPTNI